MAGEREKNVPFQFQLRAIFFVMTGACAVAWVVRLILAEPQLGLTWLIFVGIYTPLPIGSLVLCKRATGPAADCRVDAWCGELQGA